MKNKITIGILMFGALNVFGQNADKYAGCCGAAPYEYIHSDMNIFVPNAFTPNKDGANDLFFPHINGKVEEVIDFRILADEGEEILYYRPTIVYKNIENYGWNGFGEDGKAYIGAFRYTMKIVNQKGETKYIEGRACRLDCDAAAEMLKSKDGCFFPEQAGDGENVGKVDKTKPNKEKKC